MKSLGKSTVLVLTLLWMTLLYGAALVGGFAIFFVAVFTLHRFSVFPGLIFLVVGINSLRKVIPLLRKRQVAIATVVDSFHATDEDRESTLDFYTRQGQLVHAHFRYQVTLSNRDTGMRFWVLYDPEKPEKEVKKCSFFHLFIFPSLSLWVGGLFLLFSLADWLSH